MQTVKVRLRKPTRVFTFLCDGIPLDRDDACIVRSDRGLEYGVCVVPPEPCSEEMAQRLSMSVVRKATYHDGRTHSMILGDEAKARDVCLRKIRNRKLPMKLVDVEYTFDKRKVIFYFTAEDRVDFRELVRDLARELHTRIELRHIQVRDEAKMVGGLGTCGFELCCKTWLSEFVPISMKMAKRQSLSLNPSKISGQCGRLMCCLSFENAQYCPRRKVIVEDEPVEPEPEPELEEPLEAEVLALEDDASGGGAETVVYEWDEQVEQEEALAQTAGSGEAVPVPVSEGEDGKGEASVDAGPAAPDEGKAAAQAAAPQAADGGQKKEKGARRGPRKRRNRRRGKKRGGRSKHSRGSKASS